LNVHNGLAVFLIAYNSVEIVEADWQVLGLCPLQVQPMALACPHYIRSSDHGIRFRWWPAKGPMWTTTHGLQSCQKHLVSQHV